MEALIALITLTLMEIVLGIDNIIFVAIQVGRLPKSEQKRARTFGLMLALIFRIALLFSLTWIMSLVEPWFTLFGHAFSGRDLILLGGGLFLVGKSTGEIHHKIQGIEDHIKPEDEQPKQKTKLMNAIIQIMLIDIVFSFDSVITAVGMVQNLPIMIAAVVISMIVMILVSGNISDFIERNPTIKILALAFLILIGTMLIVEGMGTHVSKGYVYFAMAFSLGVESLNIHYRKKTSQKK